MDPVADPCSCCETERRKKGKPPRALVSLDRFVTVSTMFKKRDLICRLCEFCDGDALALALKTHEL